MPAYLNRLHANVFGRQTQTTLDASNLPVASASFAWQQRYGNLLIPASNTLQYDNIQIRVNAADLQDGEWFYIISEQSGEGPNWRPLWITSDLLVVRSTRMPTLSPHISAVMRVHRVGGQIYVTCEPYSMQPLQHLGSSEVVGPDYQALDYPDYGVAAANWVDMGNYTTSNRAFLQHGDSGGGWVGHGWLTPASVYGAAISINGSFWTATLPTLPNSESLAWDTNCICFPTDTGLLVPVAYGNKVYIATPARVSTTLAVVANYYEWAGSAAVLPGSITAVEKYPGQNRTFAVLNGTGGGVGGLYRINADGSATLIAAETSTIANTKLHMAVSNSERMMVAIATTASTLHVSPDYGVTWFDITLPPSHTSWIGWDVVFNRHLGMFIACGETIDGASAACPTYISYDAISWIGTYGWHGLRPATGRALAPFGHVTVMYGQWGRVNMASDTTRPNDTLMMSYDGMRWLPITGVDLVNKADIYNTDPGRSGFIRGPNNLIFVGEHDGSGKRAMRSNNAPFAGGSFTR